MNRIFLALIIGLLAIPSFSQVTDAEERLQKDIVDTLQGWQKGAVINLSFTQSTFTNWNAGGVDAFSANGMLNVFANYKKGNNAWDNTLDLAYGFINQEGNFIKTDDRIDFFSTYGRKAADKWYYSALVNFRTQMDQGFASPEDTEAISRFMAPGYLVGAVGMTYKPNDDFSLFIAPLTSKNTFVNDQRLADAGAFGVDPGKRFRTEIGGYLRMFWKKDVLENIFYTTKLDIFSNYLEKPQNLDINWENIISFKVNKFISASLILHLMYDDDIDVARDTTGDGIFDKNSPTTQFRQVFQIGLNYKL
jgi:hypothetical protein